MSKDEINSTQKKSNLPIPPVLKFPSPIENINLTPTEQRVYLQLSLEFQKVLDAAPSFQMGAYRWNQILPELLKKYAIDIEVWERISEIGDQNDEIQDQLNELIELF